MVLDVPTSERTSERSERSERVSERNEQSEAERGGVNKQASGALQSERVSEQVAPFKTTPFSAKSIIVLLREAPRPSDAHRILDIKAG